MMNVTKFNPPTLTPTQRRVEAIVKAAADMGMGGFALAKLRTIATEQIEPLVGALQPFAEFSEQAERFVDDRVRDGGTPVMPTNHFRLADFKRASALLR